MWIFLYPLLRTILLSITKKLCYTKSKKFIILGAGASRAEKRLRKFENFMESIKKVINN